MKQSERRERFKRVAEARTNKIIKLIQLLSNCSNRSAYAYEDSEIRQIFSAIEAEVRAARTKFNERKENKFSLG